MRSVARRMLYIGLVAVAGVSLSSCSFDGINSLPLPGNVGASGDSYRVTVEFTDAQNLVANSPVKFDDATVGNIRMIRNEGWLAAVEVDVASEVSLPANTNAKLAQTSLFGSQYVKLQLPADQQAHGELSDGDVIPASRTSQYASVEEVLSALSLVLNGGGLQQIRTVTSELDAVLGGRQEKANQLVGRLRTLMSSLADQRGDIRNAIDSVAALGRQLGGQTETINRGIDAITPAVGVLNEQQEQLTRLLTSVGDFGAKASGVLNRSNDDTLANLNALAPTLNALAKSGDDLTESLKIALTMPFPVTALQRSIRGDYMNLFLTLDISPGKIRDHVIPSFGREKRVEPSLVRRAADPLTAPIEPRERGKS